MSRDANTRIAKDGLRYKSKEAASPTTPEQQRLATLRATKDRAAVALDAERKRQQAARAQKALYQVVDVPVIDADHPKAQWPSSGGHGAIHWFRPKEIQGT